MYIITTGPNKEEKMSERPPEEPPFLKRLLEEVSKQLERHPLHDETAHQEMLDGLSQTFGNLSSVSPELTVIEGGDDDEASSNLPSDGPVLQLFNSDVPAESSVRDDLLHSLSAMLDGSSDPDIHVEVLTWPLLIQPIDKRLLAVRFCCLKLVNSRACCLLFGAECFAFTASKGTLCLRVLLKLSTDRVSAELLAGQTIDIECRSLTAIAQSASSSGWFQQISSLTYLKRNPHLEMKRDHH